MTEPEFYITEEGGDYRKWAPRIRHIKIFALFFPDGKVWDAYIGWRSCDIVEVRASYGMAQTKAATADV